MQYKILTIQDTPTSTGKSKKTVTLEGVDNKLGVWSDFPNYANLAEGQTVEGEIKTSPDGKWHNLVPSASQTTRGGHSGAFGGVAKAQEKKAELIEKAQDNKNEAIKIASTFAKAVECAIAEYSKDPHNLDTLEEGIRKWRKILWFEWDKYNEFPPFVS